MTNDARQEETTPHRAYESLGEAVGWSFATGVVTLPVGLFINYMFTGGVWGVQAGLMPFVPSIAALPGSAFVLLLSITPMVVYHLDEMGMRPGVSSRD